MNIFQNKRIRFFISEYAVIIIAINLVVCFITTKFSSVIEPALVKEIKLVRVVDIGVNDGNATLITDKNKIENILNSLNKCKYRKSYILTWLREYMAGWGRYIDLEIYEGKWVRVTQGAFYAEIELYSTTPKYSVENYGSFLLFGESRETFTNLFEQKF
jgi:hypothetical protein